MMRTILTIFLLCTCFTLVSTKSVTKNNQYQTLVKDMPSAKILINQNKQCDKLIESIDKQLEAVQQVESKVDSLNDTLENKSTLRKLKRTLKRESVALQDKK